MPDEALPTSPPTAIPIDEINDSVVADAQDKPDPETKLETDNSEKVLRNLKVRRELAQLNSYEQNITQRGDYARDIFKLTKWWVIAIFALLVLQGLGEWKWIRFHLADNVVLAAIGGTTASILGLSYIVTKYLFHVDDDKGN